MNESAPSALLPAGLRDILPPFAAHEADAVTRIMAHFAAHGYERVKPPMIEFEDSLLSGSGAAMANHSFRLMDPVSQRMLALRADMTLQVARIATTRLINTARPLRLSYAGQVLRVKGTQLRPERQFGQTGIELIGAEGAAADAEVILLAAGALAALGLTDVSVDLSLPTLVSLATEGRVLDEKLRVALDRKDVAAVAASGGAQASVLVALTEAVGPADRALEKLAQLKLPAAAAAQRARLAELVQLLRTAAPQLILTVDPVENRGYEYHAGVAFTLFARSGSGELGRGGRYLAQGEPATGATLFMDTILEVAPGPNPQRRLFLPLGTETVVGDRARAEGWVTVAGLEKIGDPRLEARRLRCSHLVVDGKIVASE